MTLPNYLRDPTLLVDTFKCYIQKNSHVLFTNLVATAYEKFNATLHCNKCIAYVTSSIHLRPIRLLS